MINILKNSIPTNQVMVGTPGSNHSNINWFYLLSNHDTTEKIQLKLIINKEKRYGHFHGSYVCCTR